VSILPPQPADKAYLAYGDLSLEIPALGVKTSVVGVPEAIGGWDVTWLGKNAGWLNGTAFPTWNGNSVITGHVWDADNKPGIFVDIKKLKYGDKVKIHAWGQVYTYEVRQTNLVSPSDINTVMKHEDKAWVTLVTCEEYNLLFTKYSFRRVVRAVLLSVTAEK
jgi:LPXTG-site transpeptidase (sortase) family protein